MLTKGHATLLAVFVIVVGALPRPSHAQSSRTTTPVTAPRAGGDTALVLSAAPIYLLPDSAREPLRVAAAGSALRVIEQANGWCNVQFQDPQLGLRTGYIESRYVRVQRRDLEPMNLSVPDAPVTAPADNSRSAARSSASAVRPERNAQTATDADADGSNAATTNGDATAVADAAEFTDGSEANVNARQATRPRRSTNPPDTDDLRRRSRWPDTRDGFWFNAGLGYGSGSCADCLLRYDGLSGGLTFGGRLSDRWLMGVGTTGWTRTTLFGHRESVGTLDARFRFYPVRTSGFFVTMGLGLGTISFDEESEIGVGSMLGLGWDIPVGRKVSLTPFWNGFGVATSSADANVGQIGLGVTVH